MTKIITNLISSFTADELSHFEALIASIACTILNMSPTNSPIKSQNLGFPFANIEPSNNMFKSLFSHSVKSTIHDIAIKNEVQMQTTSRIHDPT